mgnify:CR=1 FL=1
MNLPRSLPQALELVNLDDKKFVVMLGDIGILKKGPFICEKCHHVMSLSKDTTTSDNVSWRCPNKKCRRSFSVRKDSVFSEVRYPLKVCFKIYLYWCVDFPISDIGTLLDIKNTHPIQELARKFRSIAIQKYQLDLQNNPLGGPNTVQMDESAFGQAKYHKGRALKSNCEWVIGAFEENTKRVAVCQIPDRTMATIDPFVADSIQPGSKVYTDEWRSYNNLSRNGYIHNTVNHSTNFVNVLPTGEKVTTNLAEGNWTPLKKYRFKHNAHHRKYTDEYVKMWGYRRNLVHSFQDEFSTII